MLCPEPLQPHRVLFSTRHRSSPAAKYPSTSLTHCRHEPPATVAREQAQGGRCEDHQGRYSGRRPFARYQVQAAVYGTAQGESPCALDCPDRSKSQVGFMVGLSTFTAVEDPGDAGRLDTRVCSSIVPITISTKATARPFVQHHLAVGMTNSPTAPLPRCRPPNYRALLPRHCQRPRDQRSLHRWLLRGGCLPALHQHNLEQLPAAHRQVPSRIPGIGYRRWSLPLPRCHPEGQARQVLRLER